jgi:hypothetical protein
LDVQLKRRQELFVDLNSDMLKALQDELFTINNPFVHTFINAGTRFRNDTSISNMKLTIHNTHGKDMRQYNQPTAPEIAAIIFDDNHIPEPRDIIIETYE